MIILKCNDCEHKYVCKFTDGMTKIKAEILNKSDDLDGESVARVTIDCNNYKYKYENNLNISTSPLNPQPLTPSVPYQPLDIYYTADKTISTTPTIVAQQGAQYANNKE